MPFSAVMMFAIVEAAVHPTPSRVVPVGSASVVVTDALVSGRDRVRVPDLDVATRIMSLPLATVRADEVFVVAPFLLSILASFSADRNARWYWSVAPLAARDHRLPAVPV